MNGRKSNYFISWKEQNRAKVRGKQLLLLAMLLAYCPLFAQNNRLFTRLESLKKTIRQSTLADSSKVFEDGAKAIRIARELHSLREEGLIYQYYGSFYYHSNNYKKAREYYKKSIDLANQCKNLELKNSTEIRLAFMLAENDVLKAEKEFNRLLKQAKQHNYVENTIEIYNGLGILSEQRMMDDKALEYYQKGLKIAEKYNKKYFIGFLLNNMGLVKYENKQYKEARNDLERGLKLAKDVKEYRLMTNLHNNLGLVYNELKDYKASIRHYNETVALSKKQGFPFAIGAAYINLGGCYLLDKQYEKGHLYADSAITIFSQFNDPEYLGICYLQKASIYTEEKQLPLARSYVQKVLDLHKKFPSVQNYVNTFQVLSDINKQAGDYKKALEFKDRFYKLNDSIKQITDMDKMADLEVLYGRERIESQLLQEKTKNRLLDKQRELDSTEWQFIVFALGGLFLLIFGLIYIRYVRHSRKQQIFFSQRLIEQIDEERSRISRDLHDNIGQLLSVVKSKINMFNKGVINGDHIQDLEQEVGEVINQTRSISHQLHPSALEKLGLEKSLNSLLEQTQSSTGIICSMEFDVDVSEFTLPVQTQLYRVCQECISNTIRHARAASLRITLNLSDDFFVFSYRDNGNGFSVNAAIEGLGMMTIRERAKKINGKVSVNSEPQKGMSLIIKFR